MNTRRTVLRSAAWAVPAVTIATAAPAFATSVEQPSCAPSGWRKPGRGKNTKDYFLLPNCAKGQKVKCVEILTKAWGSNKERWHQMVNLGNTWAFFGSQDSGIKKQIRITLTNGMVWQGEVKFPVI